MAFTYDLTNDIGKVRLMISDTVSTDYIFTDEEIQAFLSMQENNLYLTAAQAYGTIIRSRALLSRAVSREGYSSQEHALSELRQLVKDLEQQAITAGGIQTADFKITDEHFEGYRPGYRDLNGDPVVE